MRVFGLTANLCILIAIRELEMVPEFDINPGKKEDSSNSKPAHRQYYWKSSSQAT